MNKTFLQYRARKTDFLIFDTEVVGGTDQIQCMVTYPDETSFKVLALIGKSGFFSQNEIRDQKTPAILKVDQAKNITFESEEIHKFIWLKALKEKCMTLSGQVDFGFKKFNIQFELKIERENSRIFVKGEKKLKFSECGLQAPTYFYGLFSRVHDEYELYFLIDSQYILGSEKIIKEVK